MLNWLRSRSNPARTAREIYGSIVTLTRQETFYAAWKVPDNAEGRLEMLLLHLVAALRRTSRLPSGGPAVAQALAETFVTDMDANMRELGVGDLAVPRKVKRMAAALSERMVAYSAALAAGSPDDRDLILALERNFHILPAGAATDCRRLASYFRSLGGGLDALTDEDVLAGAILPAAPAGIAETRQPNSP